MKQKNKNVIKIPNNISLIYCNKKKILIFSGPENKKSLNLKLKLSIIHNKKLIKVSLIPFSTISTIEKRNLKSLRGTTVASIKQMIIETSILLYQKLSLIGIGYKIFPVENYKDKLVMLKLGFSHFIYFRIPFNIKCFCKKQTKVFILGTSYKSITQLSNNLRALKKPEPYKGKGILISNEIVTLKKGKRV